MFVFVVVFLLFIFVCCCWFFLCVLVGVVFLVFIFQRAMGYCRHEFVCFTPFAFAVFV